MINCIKYYYEQAAYVRNQNLFFYATTELLTSLENLEQFRKAVFSNKESKTRINYFDAIAANTGQSQVTKEQKDKILLRLCEMKKSEEPDSKISPEPKIWVIRLFWHEPRTVLLNTLIQCVVTSLSHIYYHGFKTATY